MISIIVPVYNADRWIGRCINSILEQEYQDIEVILVDDCSSDSSFEICKKFAALDNRVIYHRNESNLGANKSRQRGVEISKGDYVMFVDSDDSLPDDSVQNLSKFVDRSDIIVGVKWDTHEKNQFFSAEQWRNQCAEGGLLMSPIAKLYNRSLFNDSVFDIPPHIRVCEDDIMNTRLSVRNQRDVTLFLEKKSYEYNPNDGSLTSRWRWTIDRFSEVYDVIYDSIPSNQIHARMDSLIKRRLTSIKVLYESVNKLMDLSDYAEHPYVDQLRNDVKNYQFKIPIGVAISLKMPSSLFPVCYYKAKRCLLIFKQKLTRIISI